MGAPILEGDYYNPRGEKVSSIRGGAGVRILFETNGFPHILTVYTDGWESPVSVWWHPNGVIRGYALADTAGERHGPSLNFHPGGEKKYRRDYLHGQPVGQSFAWWLSGPLMGWTTYSNGVAVVHERFDVNGVVSAATASTFRSSSA